MKNKLLIILPVAMCLFVQSNAQSTNAASTIQKEVIVNGIPYSQYAAQVKAQELQKAPTPVVPEQFPFSP